jgi:ABC-type ATPase with predicted acetyltransferase domain
MKITIKAYAEPKRPLKVLKVDKEFKTTAEPTKRVVEVSEAFGLGLDEEKTLTIYKEFTIDINPGDIVYITGESGSGKSLLLKDIADQLEKAPEFKGVIRDWELNINPETIVIESIGRNTNEALETLSYAGLNEAHLYLRKYRELSDGQKYRFKIAKLIDSNKGTWVLDEFCSTLDRTTAKAVAYCTQKAARKRGKTLIVATSHEDLLEDLNPNIHIVKKWGPEVEVKTYKPEPRECTLLAEVKIREASREEIRKLEHLHYRGKLPSNTTKIYAAYINQELAGAIAYTTPHFTLTPRNIALPQYKPTKPYQEYLKRLNRDITRIARVIVAPKYRGIGLGVKLVKETMPLTGKKYVETLAVMAKYNPFFEKAGMKKIEYDNTDPQYQKALVKLEAMGFNLELLGSKKQNINTIQKLSEQQIKELQKIVLRHFFSPKLHTNKQLQKAVQKGDKEAIAEALAQRRLKPTYLMWRNTDIT